MGRGWLPELWKEKVVHDLAPCRPAIFIACSAITPAAANGFYSPESADSAFTQLTHHLQEKHKTYAFPVAADLTKFFSLGMIPQLHQVNCTLGSWEPGKSRPVPKPAEKGLSRV
jgi:hypothetical protein